MYYKNYFIFFSHAEFGQSIANALDPKNLEGGSSTLNPDKKVYLDDSENLQGKHFCIFKNTLLYDRFVFCLKMQCAI